MDLFLKLMFLVSLVAMASAIDPEKFLKDKGKGKGKGHQVSGQKGRREPPEERPFPGAYESDMLLTPEQEVIYNKNKNGKGHQPQRSYRISKRKGLSDLYYRWPMKIIPYTITENLASHLPTISTAMSEWEKYTCIRFKEATPEVAQEVGHSNYVAITGHASGCSSYVGYIHREGQEIYLADSCFQNGAGTTMHELGHSMGFYHEQSRPDRDQYVTVHFENIVAGKESNFQKKDSSTVDTYGIPYEHGSILHYGSHYFSDNGQVTIEVRNLEDRLNLGQRKELSRYDIKHVNVMYDCPEVNECATLNPCNNGGTCIDEPGTYHCQCPEGFRGLNCDFACQDESADCMYFAGNGDCRGGEYQGWMMTNCQKTCGICQPYECKDISDICDYVYSEGYCEHTYVDYAKENCQKTCGFCNYCNPVPCLNGGTCSQLGTGFECTCAEGFTGVNCETPI